MSGYTCMNDVSARRAQRDTSRAWVDVRRNSGAAGIDRKTITDVEEYGVSRLLDGLAIELKDGRGGVRLLLVGFLFPNPAAWSGGRFRFRRSLTGLCRPR